MLTHGQTMFDLEVLGLEEIDYIATDPSQLLITVWQSSSRQAPQMPS